MLEGGNDDGDDRKTSHWNRAGDRGRDDEFTLGHVFEVPEQQPDGTIQNTHENCRSGGVVRGLGWRYKFGRCDIL